MQNPALIAHKPSQLSAETKALSYIRSSDTESTIRALVKGEYVRIDEFYSNGLTLLSELQNFLHQKHPGQGFTEQRAYRAEYQLLSNRVLLEVNQSKLVVKKGPTIGWLEKLYPASGDFLLTFPQIQGLNSAWQWYTNGIVIPVLRNKIHPYYGVYFPTRFEHLVLFDNWLKRYNGPKKTAMDIGIGSGILSLMLVKHGFQKSFGTDTNPNAIIGLESWMTGSKMARKIELDYNSLFGKWIKPTELIVFNPPWLPTSSALNRLDEAIYYPETLFPDFFKEAKERLLPDGRIVLLFSNLAQLTGVTKDHPIVTELESGNRYILDRCLKKKVTASSDKTKRNQHWRAQEEVELWILMHK
ncbi:MAG TPA: methyltransferase type 11 [Bacteroidetes bacterium]|jgi:hypothetical protein|nr:methyltransferase type 11 [Bacteroidota bacterium]